MTKPSWNDTNDDVYLNEVLFEYYNVGNAVRVCAIDPITNTEVIVVGSVHMQPYTLKMNAIRKLKYVLAKKKAEQRNRTHQTRTFAKVPFRR